MSNNKKVLENLVSRTKIYLVIILILLIVICIYNPTFIIPSIIVYIAIVGYSYLTNNKRKSEISEHLQDLTLTVDSAAKNTLINSPLPLIILETDGNVIWKSSKFVTEFANIDISNYIDDLTIAIKQEIEQNQGRKTIERQMKIGKKTYKILGEFVKSKSSSRRKSNEYMSIIYFMDETSTMELQKEYRNSQICVGIINVDNYEETMQRVENERKPEVIAKIEKSIYEWANETNGIIIKPERDTYVYIFEYRYIEKIKENKFSILDTIKDVEKKSIKQR